MLHSCPSTRILPKFVLHSILMVNALCTIASHIWILWGQFQAGSFLVSSGSHAVSERELEENIYSNDVYVETASLLEQVLVHYVL